MKFTQNDAFKKIKGILTRGGKDLQMSERSIMEQIDSLSALIANDEMELDDFVSKVESTFKTMNGNAKKDYSDFVNKWKEEHPEPEPAKEPTEQNSPERGSSELDILKAEIEALKAANVLNEKKQKLSAKKTELVTALGVRGIKDKEWLNDFLSEVNITEDLDVDAKAETYAKLYNKSKANNPPAPTPSNPSGSHEDLFAPLRAASELAKKRDEQLKV